MLVKFNNVSFSYPNKDIFANANFTLSKGEFLFLVGESGVGKSTLLRLIYFDLLPNAGTIEIKNLSSKEADEKLIPYIRRKMGIVFQDFKLLDDRSVFENIAIPLYIDNSKSDVNNKVNEAAAKVGLQDKLNLMPYNLSGGEQQRVSIARSLVNNPLLILADEPTGNLDPFTARDIIKALDDINSSGTAVIVATHNYDIVKNMSDKRIMQIKDKKIVEVKLRV